MRRGKDDRRVYKSGSGPTVAEKSYAWTATYFQTDDRAQWQAFAGQTHLAPHACSDAPASAVLRDEPLDDRGQRLIACIDRVQLREMVVASNHLQIGAEVMLRDERCE